MPTYEYVCSKCQGTFDQFQSIKEKALTICPREKCQMPKWGKGKVKRAIGAGAGLIFKGTGFYITDYRSEKYKEAAKKESAPASGGEAKAGKSDSGSSSAPAKPAAEPKKAKAAPEK